MISYFSRTELIHFLQKGTEALFTRDIHCLKTVSMNQYEHI